jgi:hypothetical protein
VPTLWKCADVIPIAKESVIRCAEDDLRLISLTSVLSKMLESCVCNWLWDHLVLSLDPYQYGCMKNSSTTHALIKLTHNIGLKELMYLERVRSSVSRVKLEPESISSHESNSSQPINFVFALFTLI